ncbi:MAG: GNAT family N-acetyltransferase [Turicibacter sp.]
MNIEFKEVTEDDFKDFELIAKWDNDDEIKYQLRPNFCASQLEDVNADELYNNFIKSSDKYLYMILDDNKNIGYVSLDTEFFMLYKDEKAAWISICVGEKEYRAKGIGKVAMAFLEVKSKELNRRRIELGVFSYNQKAFKFYELMGYTKIGEKKDFVFYNGKWHADIRMEKYI